MKKTLMEMVDKCKPFNYDYGKDTAELFLKAEELRQLGFKEASRELQEKVDMHHRLKEISKGNYLNITERKIKAYLKLKVNKYNKEHQEREKENIDTSLSPSWIFLNDTEYRLSSSVAISGLDVNINGELQWIENKETKQKGETFSENTCDYMKTDKDTIGRFIWTETPVKDYKDIPPASILEIIKDHVKRNIFDYFTIASVSHIVDPILLGRVYGSEERFFIPGCQWGKDYFEYLIEKGE